MSNILASDPFETLTFFLATDQLKRERRTTTLADGSRAETVAEHCWHLSLLTLLLEPYAPPGIDLTRVRDLVTVHDLVEVYAGDTWFYAHDADMKKREADAARKLLALLPETERERIQVLVDEFQRQDTLEARYVRALDVLHPMVVSYAPEGSGATSPLLRASWIYERKRPYLQPFPVLWTLATRLIECGVKRGVLDPG